MILVIIRIWFSEVKNILGTSWLHWRRVLSFCNEYLLSGDIHPDGKYNSPTIYDELPEWCKGSRRRSLEQKNVNIAKEGHLNLIDVPVQAFVCFD